MIKQLTIISTLLTSSLSFATSGDQRGGPTCKPKTWSDVTDTYIDLIQEYKETAESDATQAEKTEKLQAITEEMRKTDILDSDWTNEDFNRCTRESNAQQRSDYDRCDRNGGSDKCYDRADKNASDRNKACERIAHSDNVRDSVKKN